MKLLISILIALGLAIALALLIQHDPGYLLLTIGQWTIETSVVFGLLCLAAFFGLLYLLLRLLLRLTPRRFHAGRRRLQARRAQSLLNRGMEELAEGRWKAAEQSLLKGAKASDHPVLYYLGAAQAARCLGAGDRAERYLIKAETDASEGLLAKLKQAEFLLEDGKAAEARDILLTVATEQENRHPRTLELLARCHQQLGDWRRLQELLPALAKSGMYDEVGFTQLQRQVYSALLRENAHAGDLTALRALWNKMPESLRLDESLLLEYAGHLCDHNQPDEAEAALRQSLKQRWSDQIVAGYGQLGRGNVAAQLETAEDWLKTRPNNPYVLLTCGRLARRAHQLDKARGYLERSIAAQPNNADAYQELGQVLEEQGESAGALQNYRIGLRLLSGRLEPKEGVPVLTDASAATTGAALAEPPAGTPAPQGA